MDVLHTATIERLFKAIVNIDSLDDCYNFFEDLCTIKEVQDMSQRLETAILLKQGMSFSEINAKLGVSSATIGRVNKCINYGSGGYDKVFEKLGE